MLKIIEYSLLAVSMLVVIGLIMSNIRSGRAASSVQEKAKKEAHEPGKSA